MEKSDIYFNILKDTGAYLRSPPINTIFYKHVYCSLNVQFSWHNQNQPHK